MAVEAAELAVIHVALHKVIALHAILVRRAVGKVVKGGFTQLAVFQLPVILQPQADVVADGPVVILPLDRVL